MARVAKKKVTVTSIAAKLGLAPSTVTHILNQTAGMKYSEDTRQQVFKVAEQMGYQRSLLARSIKQPLRHVSVAISDKDPLEDGFGTQIFSGIAKTALAMNYFPSIQMLPVRAGGIGSLEAVQRVVELHRSRLVDGFIIDKSNFINRALIQIVEQGVPVVTVNGMPVDFQGGSIPAVVIDNFRGGLLATRHLLDLGHRRIGVITLPFARFSKGYEPAQTAQLLEGHQAAFGQAGVAFTNDLIMESDPLDKYQVYRTVDALLDRDAPPTAIFAADDAIALMVMQRLRRRNVRVPEDVSVVGYGEWMSVTRLADPSLTTVHTPMKANGETAVRMLIDLLEGRKVKQLQVSLKPELVEGLTTSGVSG